MGITFNGVHSDTYNTAVTITSMPYIPEKRQVRTEVPGRDGEYIHEDAYKNKIIETEFSIGGYLAIDRRKSARQISDWLANIGDLILDHEKDIVWKVVSVVNNVSSSPNGYVEPFDVIFECEPYQEQAFYNDAIPWQDASIAWKYANFPWQGYPRIFEVSGGESLELVNAGTYEALPIIVLDGLATSVTLDDLTFNNLNGVVYIDCKEQLVYSISGSSKINRISDFSGDFLKILPGTNIINISGTITNLTIEFDYKNTYL